MATTLIIANQYSNAPNAPTCMALTATIAAEKSATNTHSGTSGNQRRA